MWHDLTTCSIDIDQQNPVISCIGDPAQPVLE